MSHRLPAATGAEVVRAPERAGFAVVRVTGRQHVVLHPDGRATVVPVHAGEVIGPGLLRRIPRDSGLPDRLRGG